MKILNNKLGMSLVETMIVVGIMGIVMAATGSAIIGLSKSVGRIEARQDLANLVTDIQIQMSSDIGCEKSLNIAGSPQSFTNAAKKPSIKSDKTLQTQPGLPIKLTLTNNEVMENNKELDGYKLKVKNIFAYDAQDRGTDSSGNQLWQVNFVGQFESKGSMMGLYSFSRNLGSVIVAVNGSNQIIDCTNSPSSSSSGPTIADICLAFNGTYDSQTDKCTGLNSDGNSSGGNDCIWNSNTYRHGQIWSSRSGCAGNWGNPLTKKYQCFDGNVTQISGCS